MDDILNRSAPKNNNNGAKDSIEPPEDDFHSQLNNLREIDSAAENNPPTPEPQQAAAQPEPEKHSRLKDAAAGLGFGAVQTAELAANAVKATVGPTNALLARPLNALENKARESGQGRFASFLDRINVFDRNAEFVSRGGIEDLGDDTFERSKNCLLYTSPSPRDGLLSRMPSSA